MIVRQFNQIHDAALLSLLLLVANRRKAAHHSGIVQHGIARNGPTCDRDSSPPLLKHTVQVHICAVSRNASLFVQIHAYASTPNSAITTWNEREQSVLAAVGSSIERRNGIAQEHVVALARGLCRFGSIVLGGRTFRLHFHLLRRGIRKAHLLENRLAIH